jgi:hypothetical protein
LGELLAAKLEHEIRRETPDVAPNCLVEGSGFDAVQVGQISIQHHFLAANQQD